MRLYETHSKYETQIKSKWRKKDKTMIPFIKKKAGVDTLISDRGDFRAR